MHEPNGCSYGDSADYTAPSAARSTTPMRAAIREFCRNKVGAGTVFLALSTATAGLVLLLVILLIGADHDRSIELRATRYFGSTNEQATKADIPNSGQTARITTAGGAAKSAIDTLRWIRTAAFGVTAIGLLGIAACALGYKRAVRRHGRDGWPRPHDALDHRHDADQWQRIRVALGVSATELLGNRLTVRHVMKPTTTLASPTTSLRALKNMLSARPLSLVSICDPAGRLLGVVGAVDVRTRRGSCAADVMTTDPFTAPPGARLDAAVTLMLDNRIHALPIVEDGVLRGMLTTSDLMTTLDCILQAIREVSSASVSHNTDTKTMHNQDTHRFPPAAPKPLDPPDTMTAPAIA